VTRDEDWPLRDLCARIFRNRIQIAVTRMRVGAGFSLAEHSHSRIAQFDVACGCSGYWIVNGRRIVPQRVTAVVFYPRVRHGYQITAARPDAEIYSFKLRVSSAWPAFCPRYFSPLVPNIVGEESLIQPFRRLARLASFGHALSPLGAGALCEILCCWPVSASSILQSSGQISSAANDPRLEKAIESIEQHQTHPPSLAKLAKAAHLSQRHLVRRFTAVYGCSPHDYSTRRRVQRAAELLIQPALTVTAIAEALCFPSIHSFSRWFRREMGVTPIDYRKKPAML
jgi:AraC-like DNA-binding protein